MRKRGKDLEKLKSIVTTIAQGEPLDPKHRDHQLVGSWKSSRDCHIGPDWVLIYTADAEPGHGENWEIADEDHNMPSFP